jgi:hypothetical protein
MKHGNANPAKYPRVIDYIREALPKLGGDDWVQCFEELHLLTECKPVKRLARGYLFSDGLSGVHGYGR